ncbi:outer membrane beta-barrel protein [Seohaeicola saemankumensis]|uniref:outer membrane beta-barrel protein n=1 Tax=Seohaeicola saemankumensis TaxID=481181 RepID=UPI001E2CF781|nr:outer membrane beta-barrel protein [Seohaeicola saemankumensis]MCD1625701.1 outer membrane beta-barrel protein [Seohaeicola saemankumensis]
MTFSKSAGVSRLATVLTVSLAAQQALAQSNDASDTSYEFDAGVTVSVQATDNVFLTANDRRSDFVTVVSPWMGLSYRAEDFRLNLEASSAIARFAEYGQEDYEDYFLGAEAQYRVNENVFVFGGLDYELGHEGRESPDDVSGLNPTELREASGYLGIGGAIAERSFRLGLNVRDLDFKDTPTSLGGAIDNDDRDRRLIEFGGRIGIAGLEDGEVFLQGIYDQREYDQPIDNQGLGFARSSEGYQLAIGYNGMIGPMRGEVLVGLMSQNYDDARFGTTTALDIGADLSMPLDDRTDLDAIVERSIEETTISGASGYISTSAGLRLRHRVAPDMSLAAYAFLTQNDYQSISRTDHLAEAGVSLRYALTSRVYFDTNYDFRQRQSDVAGADFDEHRVSLTFGATLEPRFDADPADLAKVTGGGFYAGVQLGDIALHSKVNGTRGSGGSLTADFGDHGPAGSVFAGYRSEYGALVLGGEVDFEFNSTSWTHTGNRVFGVERDNALAITAVTGVQTQNDNLFYTRFGVISTEFSSTYQRDASAAVSQSERELGLLLGVGAKIPFGNGLSGRMEYQLRAYEDYPLGSPLGTPSSDNFANVEGLVRFGLVYDFAAKEQAADTSMARDFAGFYAGAQIGHGTLQSDNTGLRPDDGAPAFTLSATRAGQGFTGGGYAGYGIQQNGFYIGGEAEIELSSADWNIERSPVGRIYSVEKKATAGLGVRLGYVLNDNVLLYARAGVVRSDFDVAYSFRSAAVSQSTTLDGVRMGGGVEFAIGENTNVRLDYTHTTYDSNAVDYGLGVDNFDTKERLFRVGLTRQF